MFVATLIQELKKRKAPRTYILADSPIYENKRPKPKKIYHDQKIHICCNKSGLTILKLKELIRSGEKITKLGKNGHSCLHIYCSQCKIELQMVKFFLKKKLDPNLQTLDRGLTAVHLVCMNSQDCGVLRALLQHGSKLNIRNKYGYTALQLVIKNSPDFEMVQVLLEYGSSPNLETPKGRTCLELLCDQNSVSPALLEMMLGWYKQNNVRMKLSKNEQRIGLLMARHQNINLKSIKMLVNETEIDTMSTNVNGETILILLIKNFNSTRTGMDSDFLEIISEIMNRNKNHLFHSDFKQRTAFHYLCASGCPYLPFYKMFLDRITEEKEKKRLLMSLDLYRNTPLHLYLSQPIICWEILQLLIPNEEILFLDNVFGSNPLILLASHRIMNEKIVYIFEQFLLQPKINLFHHNDEYENVLTYICQIHNLMEFQFFKKFFSFFAKTIKENFRSNVIPFIFSLVDHTVSLFLYEAIDFVLKNGVSILNTDTNKNNILHKLLSDEIFNEQLFNYFLRTKEIKQLINTKNQYGVTPFHLICRKPHLRSNYLARFIKLNADVNLIYMSWKKKKSPLIICLEEDPKIEIIKLLIQSGSDLDFRNESNQTPLFRIVKMLSKILNPRKNYFLF
ncbi:ankyrin repeat-containing protein [Anaeramoeba flamelloides]|uniref:Ankyrin repeat-containing protein n=1 Tax=Anaeramoeba flamelloides TaxID=1746091 RepID=A0AAV7YGD7_9EUKA|nr:ankyrin repeat-containing protein [Anaeramoeba flamelloides]